MASSHPSPEQLQAFRAGRLAPAARQAVERHLQACAACRARTPARTQASTPAPTPAAGTRARPGSTNRFTPLAERSGSGPGRLYEAVDGASGRRVALRVVPVTHFAGPDDLPRFLVEARAAARLRHPAIAALLAADAAGPVVRIATEDVPGPTLARLVQETGPLPVPAACGLVHQAALALQYALDEGLTHRHLSPELLVSVPGDGAVGVKVLGFGLARLHATRLSGLQPGQVQLYLGSPAYADPELALDVARGDPRGDVYSLGGILTFLLAGRPPFAGTTLADLLLAQLQRDVTPLAEVRPDKSLVPVALQAVVSRMLARDPSGRYATPGEAARALAPFGPPNGLATLPRPRPAEVEPVAAELDEGDSAGAEAVTVGADLADEGPEPGHGPPALTPLFWTGVGVGSVGTVVLLGLLVALLVLPWPRERGEPLPGGEPRVVLGAGAGTPPEPLPPTPLPAPEPGAVPGKPSVSSPPTAEKPDVPPETGPDTPVGPLPPEPAAPEPVRTLDPAGTSSGRRPVPAKAALEAASTRVRDAALAGAARLGPQEQKTRARSLLTRARNSREDEPERFVLYREAAALAGQAGDMALALEALAEQAQVFAVDTLAGRTAVLEKAVAPVLAQGAPAGGAAVAQTGYAVADLATDLLKDALRQDNFDVALRLTGVLHNAGHRAGLKTLEDLAFKRAQDVRDTAREHDRIKPAEDLLRSVPDDPEACLEVGCYRAFWVGDWAAGLPLLARGKDPVLKELAARTLAAAPSLMGVGSGPDQRPPDAQAALADGWLEVAETLKGPARQAPAWRSYEGYRAALPRLDESRRLGFARAGSRLAKMIPVVPSFPASRWTFDLGTRDCIAGVRAQPSEGVRVLQGKLPLKSPEVLTTAGLPCGLRERTLEVWVYLPLPALRPRGMKVMRLEQGNAWDGLVFGESLPNRWAPGSDFRFALREAVGRDSPQETAGPTEAVHVAVTYAADGTVNLYRNGLALGPPMLSRAPRGDREYTRDKGAVVFGPMTGVIEEARLYDRCLTASEVAASHRQGPTGLRP